MAARAGDKGAFAVLISRHRPAVLALVRSFLQRHELADDAVQEASVVALVGLDRLRSPERFGAWYASIALNISRRWLREIPAGLVPSKDCPDPGLGPAEQAEAAELARRINRAIQTLAPGQREAVLAFYWQGLTHAEAAIELGIKPNAVKARLHQARAALAPQLAPYLRTERKVHAMASTPEPVWVEMNVIEVRRSTRSQSSHTLCRHQGQAPRWWPTAQWPCVKTVRALPPSTSQQVDPLRLSRNCQ